MSQDCINFTITTIMSKTLLVMKTDVRNDHTIQMVCLGSHPTYHNKSYFICSIVVYTPLHDI